MTDHRGAEVISLDERRRPIGPADQGRQRCQRLRADGSACRLYLDEEGRCRVCEPTTRAAHPSSGGRQGRRTHLGPDVPILSDRDLADLEQVVRGVLAFSRRRLTGDYDVDDYYYGDDYAGVVTAPAHGGRMPAPGRGRGRPTGGAGGAAGRGSGGVRGRP